MSTSASELASGAMAQGLLDHMVGCAGASRLEVYGGVQPAPGGAAGTIICNTTLQSPPGTVVAGALVLAVPSSGAIAVSAGPPTWARLFDGDGARLFDLKARLNSEADDPDDPAVVVVMAAAIEVGGLLRINSGAISIGG